MHYLIDIDNTLIETFYIDKNNEVHFYWSQEFKKDFGLSPVILKDLFTQSFCMAMQQTTNIQIYVQQFLKKYNLPYTPEQFLEYWLSRDARINPDFYCWIKTMQQKGHHFYIASNQPYIRMNYLINHFKDWKNTFEYIFTSSRLGVSKPNPAFFQMIQNTLHVPFSDICLIDDDIQNIKTATDLGMQTVLYQSLSDLPIITD
ncbi:MAG: hypothetical protein E7014_02990 [Alphaproteobacteria bacterium]|nr:hypothetical protein [Alphaproteobacteria bacterium]